MRRTYALAGALVAAFIVGSVVTITVRGGATQSALPPPPQVASAPVVRTDLATTTLTEGQLGYAPTYPVINRVSGTYTAVPVPGTAVLPGAALYSVDNLPVVLMSGQIPAWRSFALGMSDGPDVAELQANLIALGYAQGLFTTATSAFSVLTADAIERWQAKRGYPVNGQVELGRIVFLPGPVLVGSGNVAPGQGATPGEVPFQVTTTTRAVTVPLTPSLPDVHVGEGVSIILPTNVAVAGTITAIGPAPPSGDGSNGGSQGALGGSGQSPVPAVATVTPGRPDATGSVTEAVEVAITTQSVRQVLAAPVAALLALANGGYGVEVVSRSGARHLVGVTTGLFAGTRVQITGRGIRRGTELVVAQ